jgi:DNA-binding transcriptional MerR regulator
MIYSSKKIFKMTGEKKQRIQYWVGKGLFQPVDKGRGVGTSRGFSEGNLLEISLIQTLTPILKNVNFIKSILNEIRIQNPSYFAVPNAEDSLDKNECILTVLFMSQDDMMVYIHDLKEAQKCINEYLSFGFKSFQMDLNVLKHTIIERIKTI